MAKTTTKPVLLKYSHAIKKGRTSRYEGRETSRQFDEFYNTQTRDLSKMVDGGILEKRISIFRHWFRFIVLARELEEQDTVLILKKKEHKIKVNKSMYEGWDLDTIVSKKFDDWFFKENHRQLFINDISRVLSKKDKVSSDLNRITIEFDVNRRLNDVIKDLRRMNKEQNMFRGKSDGYKSRFEVNGRVIDATLQNRYNALVLKLEGKLTNKQIVTHELQYIRPTSQKTKDGYSTQVEHRDDMTLLEQQKNKSYKSTPLKDDWGLSVTDRNKTVGKIIEPNYAITMFDLLTGTNKSWGAFQILLSVCDGYFVKHPTKTYLE
jgi:hypothetical protein|tara:strand:- start:322 stop:1284 length:963 start_codon:yes stop_codon:yes gene_type:complete